MQDPKKNIKKKRRCAARLKATRGIICTEKPQPYLIICNAGMDTGLEKENIIHIIEDLGLNISLPRFIAEKGESYSFLLFPDVSSATEFYITCDGKVALADNEPPLVLSYVENIPAGETICECENPEGLTILEEFITKDEEQQFLRHFDWNHETSNLKNRQVRHYGYEFHYGSNDVDLNSPLPEKIPEYYNVLFKRLKEQGFDLGTPDQLTINKYLPGQGIPSHVDKHSPFGETILSLSLGSDVVMDWKHPTGKHVPVKVNARSMLLMQGEARYDWTHGIHSRTWDPIIENRISETNKPIKVITLETVKRKTRISLTFRWTRSGRCECKYKTLCDSVDRSADYADEVARNLEDLHVHQVYEQISYHFSKTRAKPWPKVVEFMENLKPGSVVIDLGCGNGKNVLERNDLVQIAADTCEGLLLECKYHIASTAGADCVRLDALYANIRDACADAIICIAVIHHFSNRARRKQAVETIARLLCPGGRALITVWSKDQGDSNYLLKTKDEPLDEDLRSVGEVVLPVHENRTEFLHNDLLVPWKLRFNAKGAEIPKRTEETFLRYYHVFDENEFENLCREVPGICVENSVFDEGNYCVTIRKC